VHSRLKLRHKSRSTRADTAKPPGEGRERTTGTRRASPGSADRRTGTSQSTMESSRKGRFVNGDNILDESRPKEPDPAPA